MAERTVVESSRDGATLRVDGEVNAPGRRAYRSPKLTRLGSTRELTLGGVTGSLDDTFGGTKRNP